MELCVGFRVLRALGFEVGDEWFGRVGGDGGETCVFKLELDVGSFGGIEDEHAVERVGEDGGWVEVG